MGNGIFGSKGCNPFYCVNSHYEINNNLYGNYGDMKIDKDKKIITNIFIPNCQVKISPQGSIDNNNKKNLESPIQKEKNRKKFKTENTFDKKESCEIKKQLNKYFNQAIKGQSNKEIDIISPTLSGFTNFSKTKKNFDFDNYTNDFFEYLNKLRTEPNSIIEDIENLMKNNIKIIDGRDCLVSDLTNEIIKLKDNFIDLENIKHFLENEEPSKALNLNDNLKFKSNYDIIELTDNKINEIVLEKKRNIIFQYPNCFFYPIFIKDIKINIIILLSNYILREKIFLDEFKEFYITTYNIKNNRFFAILCFA